MDSFNYAQAGYYFVTICTHNRREILGNVVEGRFNPTAIGEEAKSTWLDLPLHHPAMHLDELVIMPNHVHGIIVLEWDLTADTGSIPTNPRKAEVHPDWAKPGPKRGSLGAIIGSYKAAVSRKLNWKSRHNTPLWQRKFFDHVIQTEKALQAIREYIVNNPLSWHFDELNARHTKTASFYKHLSELEK
ncbi:transposase [bacterium]|nr:transposase [bacterium]